MISSSDVHCILFLLLKFYLRSRVAPWCSSFTFKLRGVRRTAIVFIKTVPYISAMFDTLVERMITFNLVYWARCLDNNYWSYIHSNAFQLAHRVEDYLKCTTVWIYLTNTTIQNQNFYTGAILIPHIVCYKKSNRIHFRPTTILPFYP